jgi:hypothetical protein
MTALGTAKEQLVGNAGNVYDKDDITIEERLLNQTMVSDKVLSIRLRR